VHVCVRVHLVVDVNGSVVSSVLGGLKSLQSSEALLGFASSLESMTMTVRDAMIESWGITDEMDEEEESEEDLAAAVGEGDERPMESNNDDTETEHCERSVQSDSDEGCSRLMFLLYE